MKWMWVSVAAVVLAGCDYHFENPHLGVRGLTEEDIKAPPGNREIKAAIINDIRERRALHLILDEGRPEPPKDIKLDSYGVEATRIKGEFPLWRVIVKADPVERVHAVNEVAYWDNEQYLYYYHYEGGNPHRDIWLGPYAIRFPKPPDDSDQH